MQNAKCCLIDGMGDYMLTFQKHGRRGDIWTKMEPKGRFL